MREYERVVKMAENYSIPVGHIMQARAYYKLLLDERNKNKMQLTKAVLLELDAAFAPADDYSPRLYLLEPSDKPLIVFPPEEQKRKIDAIKEKINRALKATGKNIDTVWKELQKEIQAPLQERPAPDNKKLAALTTEIAPIPGVSISLDSSSSFNQITVPKSSVAKNGLG